MFVFLRKNIIATTLIALLLIGVTFDYISYFFTGGQNVILCEPEAIVFYSEIEPTDDGELIFLTEENFTKELNAYYVDVSREYLNNNDVYLYITGDIYNYPFKPTVKMNGNVITDITMSNSGNAGHKLYHVSYHNTVYSQQKYEFYIRAGKKTSTINIIFY